VGCPFFRHIAGNGGLFPAGPIRHRTREIRSELNGIAAAQTEATAFRRMAEIWLLQGQPDKAREALARATLTCPGYAALPDLAPLAAE
jgi:hypothetical protein